MAYYITQDDIERAVGQNNVTAWSNRDATSTSADETAITDAIDDAESLIHDKFRGGRYSLPFSPVPARVRRWAADLAAWSLYVARGLRDEDAKGEGGKMQARRDRVLKEMAEYMAGSFSLGEGDSECALRTGEPSAPVVVQ